MTRATSPAQRASKRPRDGLCFARFSVRQLCKTVRNAPIASMVRPMFRGRTKFEPWKDTARAIARRERNRLHQWSQHSPLGNWRRFALALVSGIIISACVATAALRLSRQEAWVFDPAATERKINALLRAEICPPDTNACATDVALHAAWSAKVMSLLAGHDGGPADLAHARAWLAAGEGILGRDYMVGYAGLDGYPTAPLAAGLSRAQKADRAQVLADILRRQRHQARQEGVAPEDRIYLLKDDDQSSAWAAALGLSNDELITLGTRAPVRRASARLPQRGEADIVVYGPMAHVLVEGCRLAQAEAARAACRDLRTQSPPPTALVFALSVVEVALTGGSETHIAWTPDARRGAHAVMVHARLGRLSPGLYREFLQRAEDTVDVTAVHAGVEQIASQAHTKDLMGAEVIDTLGSTAHASLRLQRLEELAQALTLVGVAIQANPELHDHTVFDHAEDLTQLRETLILVDHAGPRWRAISELTQGRPTHLAARRVMFTTIDIVVLLAGIVGVSGIAGALVSSRQHRT